MEGMVGAVALIIGLVIGFAAGYFIGKARTAGAADLSLQQNLLTSMSSQISEIKVKFDEVEKSRSSLEKAREREGEQREQRLRDWIENTGKLFEQITKKSDITAAEKEKRIEDWMGATKKFFNDQKDATEKFLLEQGKSREDIEKQRDAQIRDMRNMIETFTRTVSGTKTRGMVGEDILGEVLQNSIQAGLVVKNLKTDGGDVEFAWKLDASRYIPIDAKLPDIFELVEKYNASQDPDEQKACRKDIVEKTKKEVRNVQKYQNLPNTFESCILVAPPAALEIAPELVSIGKESNVYVCTYRDVFPIAHVLQEQYIRMKETGDIGTYRKLVDRLLQVLGRIDKLVDTVDKGMTIVTNAKKNIKDEVVNAYQFVKTDKGSGE
ncbi:MAG: DNA recombination protein RmuC [Candidatus Omnitrophica bacterium]|nr:DNA recombination protein RmuC [Candidatus Omnitrophota bacterium]